MTCVACRARPARLVACMHETKHMLSVRNRGRAALHASALLVLAACGAAPQQAGDTAQARATDDTSPRAPDAGPAQVGAGDTPIDAPVSVADAQLMLVQIASVAGGMHAMARSCDPGIDVVHLIQARDRLRSDIAAAGADVATFDREFAAAHADAETQFRQAPPLEQRRMCNELEAMAARPRPDR